MTDQDAPTATEAATGTIDTPVAPDAIPAAPNDETVTLSKAEVDALRRTAAESERGLKRLQDQQKKAEEAKKAEEGKWQELAQEAQQREADARATAEKVQAEARIARLAGKHKFIDPMDIIGRVSAEDAVDDASVEVALERIAAASPHLVQKEAPGVPEIGQVLAPSAAPQADGRPQPPAGKAPLVTQADVEALSDAEFQERYAEVQAVLKSTQ